MPGGQKPAPAVQGLQQAAMTPEELIQQRQAINQAVSGDTPAQPIPIKPRVTAQGHGLTTRVPDVFANLRNTYDPQGMIAALKAAGYTGMRTADIPLPDEIDFNSLMLRANAIR